MKVINVFFVAEGHKDQTAEKSVISCQEDWSPSLCRPIYTRSHQDGLLLKKPDHKQNPTKCKNSNSINMEKYLSSTLLGIEYHKDGEKKPKHARIAKLNAVKVIINREPTSSLTPKCSCKQLLLQRNTTRNMYF